MTEKKEWPANPFEGLPLHHLLFLKIRDGGGAHKAAHGVAELHGITIDELKAACRLAGDELIEERGHLLVYEKPVYEWATTESPETSLTIHPTTDRDQSQIQRDT